jgi:microsomal dipeptidase-like Zn-dependent dipeptidase
VSAPGRDDFPGLTDIHAHPAMNAFLWDRDLRRHYFTYAGFNPLATLTDFKLLRKGGVKVLWSSLHVPEHQYFELPPIWLLAHVTKGGRQLLENDPWNCLLTQMDEMEAQVHRASTDFGIAHSNQEFDEIRASGRTAIVHTVEGGHVLGGRLSDDNLEGRRERVRELASRGVASITLAHLFPNELAGHVDAIPKEEHKILFWKLDPEVDPDRGLTEKGQAVVEQMVKSRILPDVSHCTPNARTQIYELVDNRIPVIASHTGVHSMNPAPYNLSASDVRAIKASRGVIGVIFMPYWLEQVDPGPGLSAIWRTMDQIRNWCDGSWEHVALGTDFDGFTNPPDDCKSEAELPRVADMLDAQGLTTEEIRAVLGGNARRVLREGWR